MRKTFLLTILLAATHLVWAQEKTDITEQYVTNASFEADDVSQLSTVNNNGLRGYSVSSPAGWTVTNSVGAVSLIVTAQCYTDNDFGLVTTLADGQQAYYQRWGWSDNPVSTSVRQTTGTMPKGNYQLSVSTRTAYANAATSSFDLVAAGKHTTVAFSQGSKNCIPTMS